METEERVDSYKDFEVMDLSKESNCREWVGLDYWTNILVMLTVSVLTLDEINLFVSSIKSGDETVVPDSTKKTNLVIRLMASKCEAQ